MEQMRKWVMMPADAEQGQNSNVTNDDILSVIRLYKQNHVDDNGNLLKNGKPLTDIFSCISEKASNRFYKHYLDLKANIPEPKTLSVKTNKKPAVKKTNKKSSTWEWHND